MFSLRRLAARLTVLVPFAALFAVACEHSPSAPGVPATITVTRNPDTLAVTTSKQFVAIARDADGSMVGISPTWSVAAGGGTINGSGLFTAAAAIGTFTNTVKASYGSLSGTASVTVVAGPLATITVTPTPTTLAIGATQQYTAVGKDASGNTVAISPTWAVAGGSGSISGSGLFTAGTVPGTFTNTVMATSGGISGHATVTVTAGPLATITVTPNPALLVVGATQQFTAAGKDASGNPVAITPTWSVVAGGGAVNATTGVFTAGTVSGTFPNTVQASSGGIKATATVVVSAGPLASILVTPNPAALSVSLSRQFTAVGNDASGNVVAITPVWSVVAGGGTIGAAGLFTAGTTLGTYANTVKATSGSVSGTATVIVTSGVLATITVTPSPTTLAIGDTQQFTAVGKDAGGNVVVIAPTWAMVAGGGAVDLTTGLFTAGNTTGTYTNTVRASVGSLAGFATVIVTSGPLASITVTPNPVSVQTNGTQRFTAIGRDGSGNEFLISPIWSVVNPVSGSIDSNTGVFTVGNTAGTFNSTVKATSGAVSGFATVTVTAIAPILDRIVVSPDPASVQVNGAAQFAATGLDGNGDYFPISVQWSVMNPASGSIDPNTGAFVASGTPGTYINAVRATSGAIAGYATVEVTAVPPPPPGSPLGRAAKFGILAGTGITCAISGTINGSAADIGSYPTITYTGFSPVPTCTYTGTIPLPGVVSLAKDDLVTAFIEAQTKVCDVDLTGFDLGFYDGSTPAKTLAGDKVYCFSSSAGLTGTLKLTGSAAAKWTFQVGTTLTSAAGASNQVVLAGGAIPDNVYWVVGSSATLGTSSTFQGNIMALVSITLNNGATLLGRALARNGAVDMTAGAATITKP